MGCGISKFGIADNAATRTLQPFRRKIVESHKNDHHHGRTTNSTPSTELLLKHRGKNDTAVDTITHYTHQIDTSSPRKSVSSATKTAEALVKENIILERKECTKRECYESAIKKNGGAEMENEAVESIYEANVGVERGDKRDNTESEDDDDGGRTSDYDGDGGRISDYDGSLWIGSPSFREYCSKDCPSEDSFKIDGDSDGEKKETKTIEDKKKGNAYSKPNEGLVTKSTRKGRKGRRFRKVFPTGRPQAMRSLFHVTSCYNPKVSAARDNKLGKPIEKTV